MIEWLVAFYYCSTTQLIYFYVIRQCKLSLKLVLLHNQDFTLFTNEQMILPKYIKSNIMNYAK